MSVLIVHALVLNKYIKQSESYLPANSWPAAGPEDPRRPVGRI
jgi:hypothetical protein